MEERGIKILGTPIGHPEHVRRFLVTLSDEHQTLMSQIPLVGDVQAALLLLAHCSAGSVSTQRQWKGSPGGTTRACWSA